MILARLLYGKKIELVIDGTIVDIANVNRARTQKIRRVRGKVWWAKRRRKIVRRANGKVVEFGEVKYGMLMMVLCDREGRIYDVCLCMYMLMLLDIVITGGVNLRSNFSPSVEINYKVWKNVPSVVSCLRL